MKKLLPLLLTLLLLCSFASALNTQTIWNSFTGKLDFIRSANWTDDNVSLGTTDIYGNFKVMNESGGDVLFVNVTSGKTEFWHPAEGANDYLSLYHDGTYGYLSTGGSHDLWFAPGGGDIFVNSNMLGYLANTKDLGTSTYEWRGAYIGEDANSGTYFGLDQDARIWYNETSRDELIIEHDTGNVSVVAQELRVWDEAEGSNDYVSVYHDGTNARIAAASGELHLDSGTGTSIVAYDSFAPVSSNTYVFGSTSREWKSLYLGEDANSGAYFGLDQDWRIYYNETDEDALIFESGGTPKMTLDSNGVGIGTSAPGFELDVRGSSGDFNLRGTANTGSAIMNLVADNAADNNDIFRIQMADGGDFTFGHYNGSGYPVEFILDASGNVGIGTTSPTAKLSVSELVQIQGDSSPQFPSSGAGLEIGYDSDDTGGDTTGRGSIQVYDRDTPGYKDLKLNAYSIQFRTGEVNRMYLKNSGELGIGGQTSPGMALHVGTGSSSHSLTNSQNDTYITGKLEVDGTSWFDGATRHYGNINSYSALVSYDNVPVVWGNVADVYMQYSTAQATSNTLLLGVDEDNGNSMIFTQENHRTKDHDHPAQSNPTLFMQSNEDPDTNNTQYMALTHDGDAAIIDSGTDEINLEDTTYVAGNLNIADHTVGSHESRMCYNGSQMVFEGESPNGDLWSCGPTDAGSWSCTNITSGGFTCT